MNDGLAAQKNYHVRGAGVLRKVTEAFQRSTERVHGSTADQEMSQKGMLDILNSLR